MAAFALCLSARSHAQDSTVTAQVEMLADNAHGKRNKANVVVWLNSLDPTGEVRPASQSDSSRHPRLVQQHKRFEPHVLVVPVGALVEFPNHDPFFHNVFSLFEGKRFDLGLYEAGTSYMVHFDRRGVSYIFCNIHPEMSAVVLALKTPYSGISDGAGKISIEHVPEGRYTMQVWAETSGLENLKRLTKSVTVAEQGQSLGVIRVLQ